LLLEMSPWNMRASCAEIAGHAIGPGRPVKKLGWARSGGAFSLFTSGAVCAGLPAPSWSRGAAMCAADTRRRALVVEDQPDTRTTLGLLLEMSGYEVRLAADGAEGVRIALTWRPDAIVSDIGLPVLDGYELARRVRAA